MFLAILGFDAVVVLGWNGTYWRPKINTIDLVRCDSFMAIVSDPGLPDNKLKSQFSLNFTKFLKDWRRENVHPYSWELGMLIKVVLAALGSAKLSQGHFRLDRRQ